MTELICKGEEKKSQQDYGIRIPDAPYHTNKRMHDDAKK